MTEQPHTCEVHVGAPAMDEVWRDPDMVMTDAAVDALRKAKTTWGRQSAVMENGWDPWHTPAKGMHFGQVEDRSRNSNRREGLFLFGVFASLAIAFFSLFYFPLLIIVGGIGMVLSLFFYTKSGLDSDEADRWVKTRRVFTGAIPIRVWDMYQRDRRLFDRVYIASNDESLFSELPKFVDPLLVGRIGSAFYLGASWDLAREYEDKDEQDEDDDTRS